MNLFIVVWNRSSSLTARSFAFRYLPAFLLRSHSKSNSSCLKERKKKKKKKKEKKMIYAFRIDANMLADHSLLLNLKNKKIQIKYLFSKGIFDGILDILSENREVLENLKFMLHDPKLYTI